MTRNRLVEFIRQLDIAGKSLTMYSESHPQTKQALELAFQYINEFFQTRNPLHISLVGSDLLIDSDMVPKGDPIVERFVRNLDARYIRNISLQKGFTYEEMVKLFRLLSYTPQRIKAIGGFEKVVEQEGLNHVQINKLKYGIITEGQQMPAGGVPFVSASVDDALLSQLLLNVQNAVSGTTDFKTTAAKVEQSLEDHNSSDMTGLLFRLFQNIAVASPALSSPAASSRESFLEMYRSFSPKLQGKLLLNAVLNKELLDKSSLRGFYQELTPEELEGPMLSILLIEQVSKEDLERFFHTLVEEQKIPVTQKILQKLYEVNILVPPAPPEEDWTQKSQLTPEEISKIPQKMQSWVEEGKLEEADRLFKRALGYLNSGSAEQKIAVLGFLPSLVSFLSTHEHWKNLPAAVSIVVTTNFHKEADPRVVKALLPYLLSQLRSSFESANWKGFKELMVTLEPEVARRDFLTTELEAEAHRVLEVVKKPIAENTDSVTHALDLVRFFGPAGVEYMMEWLGVEEDQHVRSRLIQSMERLEKRYLVPAMEKRLSDSRWYVVRNMITIADRLKLKESSDFCLKVINHPEPRVAKEIIKLVYRSISPSTYPVAVSLVNHQDKNVRLQAIRLLGLFASPAAHMELKRIATTDPLPEARQIAASYLKS